MVRSAVEEEIGSIGHDRCGHQNAAEALALLQPAVKPSGRQR